MIGEGLRLERLYGDITEDEDSDLILRDGDELKTLVAV
jgi:hypothetical protein